jgi:hypothetical protein
VGQNISKAKKGKPGHLKTTEQKRRMSEVRMGKKRPASMGEKVSKAAIKRLIEGKNPRIKKFKHGWFASEKCNEFFIDKKNHEKKHWEKK